MILRCAVLCARMCGCGRAMDIDSTRIHTVMLSMYATRVLSQEGAAPEGERGAVGPDLAFREPPCPPLGCAGHDVVAEHPRCPPPPLGRDRRPAWSVVGVLAVELEGVGHKLIAVLGLEVSAEPAPEPGLGEVAGQVSLHPAVRGDELGAVVGVGAYDHWHGGLKPAGPEQVERRVGQLDAVDRGTPDRAVPGVVEGQRRASRSF